MTIDDLNYARDSRTQPADPGDTLEVYDPDVDGYVKITIPGKWAVCPVCDGNGKHVNPSIDAGGLPRDFLEDPDFMDDYMGGAYDVTCNRCNGRTTVWDRDYDALPYDERRLVDDHLKLEAEMRAEELAERMMGC